MRNGSGAINPATGGWTTSLLGNQGGGYCSRLAIANDGYKLLGTDTGQLYIRSAAATSWTPLIVPPTTVTATELDNMASTTWGDDAIYDCDIAKTNSNNLYFVAYGYVWKSTNRGGTVTRTARAFDSALNASGQANRMTGRRLAIDPAGTAVVALGTSNGLFYTTDSGTTWTQNAGIPAPTATGGDKNVLIAYDVTSATSGSPLQTQTVYVYVGGKGVYKSTTGVSGTFSLMTSSPVAASTIICCAGKPFVAGAGGFGDATIQFYNGTAWTSSGSSAQTLCYNPADTTKMWAITSGGNVLYSSNTGTSFTNVTSSLARSAIDVPWLGWTNEAFMSCGDVVYDATNTQLVFVEGVGAWQMSPPSAAAALTWTSITRGIANLVAVHALITPSGNIITSSHDRAFFGFTRTGAGTVSVSHGVDTSTSIRHGQQTDYAIDNPNYIVGVDVGGGTLGSGPLGGVSYSTTGGAPNTYFANQPVAGNNGNDTFYGGNIAVGNSNNIVYVPTYGGGNNKARPQYTTNGGATWNNCVMNPTYDGVFTNFHNTYVYTRQIVVADKANPGTFYLYSSGDGSASAAEIALRGVWKSTDGGATWTKVSGNIIDIGHDFYNGKLKMTSAGHLTWCCGESGGNYYATPDTCTLMFSNTGGTSWAGVSGMSEPIDFSWGAAKPGASYQTLYAYGWVSGVRGLYRMDDFNPATPGGTWTLLDRWPGGLTGGNLCISADPNSYGRLVIGSSIVGFRYLDYTDTAHGT